MTDIRSIAIMTNTLHAGGAELQSIRLAGALADRHRIHYIIYYGEKSDPRMEAEIRRVGCPVIRLRGGHLRKMIRLRRYFREHRIGVCFSYLATTNVLNAVIGRMAGVRTRIGGIRSSRLSTLKLLVQRYLHNHWLTGTIFNNQSGYRAMTGRGFRADKAWVIPNGVAVSITDPENGAQPEFGANPESGANPVSCANPESGANPNPGENAEPEGKGETDGRSTATGGETVTILTVARFAPVKDYPTALEAMKQLLQKLPDQKVRYVIAGFGEQEQQIRQMAEQPGLGGRVDIIVRPDNPEALIRSADIYLSASTFEGLSNSVMEAMAMGRPVVVTEVGDNPELTDHGRAGLLAPVGDASQLAGHLYRLVTDPEERRRLGRRGYEHVKKYYSMDAFRNAHLELIERPHIAVIGLKGLPAFGGAAAVGEQIIRELQDRYRFTVYATASHTDHPTGPLNGYRQIVFQALPFRRLNTLWYYLRSALHALFSGDYDMVHLHHRDAAFITMLLKRKYRVLLTTHGSFGVRDKWKAFESWFTFQEKWFVRKADRVVCVSANEQEQYQRRYGLEADYVPNGIEKINPAELPETGMDRPYLFFGAGRIIRTKGCEILLRALHEIGYTGRLVIAGDLDQTPEYKKEVLELAEGLDMQFLGLIRDKTELYSWLNEARLFVFPSSREAMSMMLLEGASVRTPIVCSDIIQNRDIFTDDEVLFFETDNVADLGEKIRWAEANYPEMQKKSERAAARLQKHHLWTGIANRYADMLDHLLKSNGKTGR